MNTTRIIELEKEKDEWIEMYVRERLGHNCRLLKSGWAMKSLKQYLLYQLDIEAAILERRLRNMKKDVKELIVAYLNFNSECIAHEQLPCSVPRFLAGRYCNIDIDDILGKKMCRALDLQTDREEVVKLYSSSELLSKFNRNITAYIWKIDEAAFRIIDERLRK